MPSSLLPLDDPCLFGPLSPSCPRPPLTYGVEEAERAWRDWGANCGPWALAAVLGCDLDAVRPLLPAFVRRPYTKETDMRAALDSAGAAWEESQEGWPSFGLVRVAWHGPWWDDTEPFARLRHSHWIATHDRADGRWVFDGNAIAQGGWLPAARWCGDCVPALLAACEPQATGAWRAVERFALDGIKKGAP